MLFGNVGMEGTRKSQMGLVEILSDRGNQKFGPRQRILKAMKLKILRLKIRQF